MPAAHCVHATQVLPLKYLPAAQPVHHRAEAGSESERTDSALPARDPKLPEDVRRKAARLNPGSHRRAVPEAERCPVERAIHHPSQAEGLVLAQAQPQVARNREPPLVRA